MSTLATPIWTVRQNANMAPTQHNSAAMSCATPIAHPPQIGNEGKMSLTDADRRTHWETVYDAKHAAEVSWYQREPELSLKLIRRAGLKRESNIVDVGGGTSTLVDHLIGDGFANVTVLDIAASALEQTRKRLGAAAERVEWVVRDVTTWRPAQEFDLWHDRAVLHFLTNPAEQRTYAEVLRAAVRSGGWAIIGGFAPGGPAKCSGLDVVQHDAESLGALLGDSFVLLETHGEVHVTPQGRDQRFRFHLFMRK